MTIETKYNIGDEVWVMCNNKPLNAVVSAIYTMGHYSNVIDEGMVYQTDIKYDLRPVEWHKDEEWEKLFKLGECDEPDLYPTKEELLKSL